MQDSEVIACHSCIEMGERNAKVVVLKVHTNRMYPVLKSKVHV